MQKSLVILGHPLVRMTGLKVSISRVTCCTFYVFAFVGFIKRQGNDNGPTTSKSRGKAREKCKGKKKQRSPTHPTDDPNDYPPPPCNLNICKRGLVATLFAFWLHLAI